MFKLTHPIFSTSNDSRFFALLMAFSGGATDVYSHNYFDGLVATQTGNVILLASDFSQKNWLQTLPKLLSIIAFTVGFLLGIWIKQKNFSQYWRCYTMLPAIFSSLIIPLLPEHFYLFNIGFLAFGSGLLMLTFNGITIEDKPYTIMMTSGNYRKMLNEWYIYWTSKKKSNVLKRNAQNYTIVVLAFVVGACLIAFSNQFLGIYTIWVATITFALSFLIELHEAKRLVDSNLNH